MSRQGKHIKIMKTKILNGMRIAKIVRISQVIGLDYCGKITLYSVVATEIRKNVIKLDFFAIITYSYIILTVFRRNQNELQLTTIA